MKTALSLALLVMVLSIHACTPRANAATAPLPGKELEPTKSTETQVPTQISPTEVNLSADQKRYSNDLFGLSFQYPSNWYGPSDYVSDGSLRVEIGSTPVSMYGEQTEQPSVIKNSYNVVFQYTKNNQNSFWKDTYQSLVNLRDGESLSNARSLITRVRQFNIGRFTGFEYITTLSETAQTDHFYIRAIMVFDERSNNLLTIMGQPTNVETSNGTKWRDAYRTIDEANQTTFQEIVQSITIR